MDASHRGGPVVQAEVRLAVDQGALDTGLASESGELGGFVVGQEAIVPVGDVHVEQ